MSKWAKLCERLHATETEQESFHFPSTRGFSPERLEAFRRVAIERVRKCGVPICEENGWEFQWDGEKINTGRAKGHPGNTREIQHPSSILHDLAHWSVCTEASRLGVPDFGLGHGPDSVECAPLKLSAEAAQVEEERASLLGILMEYQLGMPAGDTLSLHQWHFDFGREHEDCPGGASAWKGFDAAMDWLQARGFIDHRGRVRWRAVSMGVLGR